MVYKNTLSPVFVYCFGSIMAPYTWFSTAFCVIFLNIHVETDIFGNSDILDFFSF